MIKVVTLFLIAIIVLAMFGRLRIPKIRKDKLKAKKCSSCNRYLIEDNECDCKKRKG